MLQKKNTAVIFFIVVCLQNIGAHRDHYPPSRVSIVCWHRLSQTQFFILTLPKIINENWTNPPDVCFLITSLFYCTACKNVYSFAAQATRLFKKTHYLVNYNWLIKLNCDDCCIYIPKKSQKEFVIFSYFQTYSRSQTEFSLAQTFQIRNLFILIRQYLQVQFIQYFLLLFFPPFSIDVSFWLGQVQVP